MARSVRVGQYPYRPEGACMPTPPPCRGSAWLPTVAAGVLLMAAGCAAWNPFKRSEPAPHPTGDSLVLRDGKWESTRPTPGTPAAELEAAKQLYQKGEFAKAEKLFAKLADNEKNPPAILEEARFYEAECQRLQARYPAAVDTYKRLLKDFPSGAHQKEALKQMFDIANYWLDETREVIKAYNEQREGKRHLVMPVSFVHFDKTKPLFDLEGHALSTLEQVYLNDPIGPLGERALWYIGNVRLFHEDYRDADFYFNQIIKNYPNGEFAPKALELSIICKQLATGGPEYDGRKLDEARKLVELALKAYPELASQKSEFLHRQVATITLQQAAKDFEVARFYERTFHPGAAYFCYEIVRRRYPGTKYAAEATRRMQALEARARRELQQSPTGDSDKAGGPLLPPGPLVPGTPLTAPPAANTPPAPRLLPWLNNP
jgi:outer membrane protein assembly factor BamD (BamD/ComL family)